VSADKDYYGASNIQAIEALAINADGVQRLANIKPGSHPTSPKRSSGRRAGIEPSIQHAQGLRHGQKSDEVRSDGADERVSSRAGVQPAPADEAHAESQPEHKRCRNLPCSPESEFRNSN
jgi:hypothetical protein